MRRYHHFDPPRKDDYPTEDDYQEAVAAWESAEDDYADEYMERQRMEVEFN